MIYVNGIKINISDMVRLTFLEGPDSATVHVVSEICMQFDSLKIFYDAIGKTIFDHEAKAAQSQENARKDH